MNGVPLLELQRVTRWFGATRAVDAVSLRLGTAETVALVGASGSGKTTVARLIVGLETPDAGTVRLLGVDVAAARGPRRRAILGRVGMIAQDPYAALSPSASVLDVVAEPLRIAGVGACEAGHRAARALADVGLGEPRSHAHTADELSGGERQRVGLARAIVHEPALLIADEATSMLDAPRQQEFVRLLPRVRSGRSLALLFITHDLALAAQACERVVVMDAGRIVEDGPAETVLAEPRAASTRALVDAARARQAVMTQVLRAVRSQWPRGS